jgi:hypothetical protein
MRIAKLVLVCTLALSFARAEEPADKKAQATYLVEFTYTRCLNNTTEPYTIARVAVFAQAGRVCKITASSRYAMPEEDKDVTAYLNAGRTWLANSTLQTVLCHTQESLDDYWSLSKASIKHVDQNGVELDYLCSLNLSTTRFRGGSFQIAQKRGMQALRVRKIGTN